MHLDEALVKATGLPGDASAWTRDKQRVYCQALEMLRLVLPIWSVQGYSNRVDGTARLQALRRAVRVAEGEES